MGIRRSRRQVLKRSYSKLEATASAREEDAAAAADRLSRSRVVRAMGGSLFAAGTSQVLLVISGVLVARGLGPEDRGYAALLIVVSGVCYLLGSIGLPSAVTYYIARDPGNTRAIVRSLRGVGAVQVAATLCLQVVILAIVVRDDPDRVRVAAAVSLLLAPGLFFFGYGLAVLQGQQRFAALNVLRTFPTAAYVFGVLALFATHSADLVRVMCVWSLASFVGGMLALGAALLRLQAVAPSDSPPPSRAELSKFGLKGFLSFYSPVDVFRLDQAVVGLFLTPVALGLYVVAQAFTGVPRVVAYSIGLVAYPRVASESRPRAARAVMWKYWFFGVAVSALAVGVLVVLADVLVRILYGTEFDGAAPIARILLVGTFFMAARRVLTDCINGLGHPGLGTVAEVSSWIVLVPAVALLLPTMGAAGIALALAISWAFSLLLLLALALLVASPAVAASRRWGKIELGHRGLLQPANRATVVVATTAVALSLLCSIAVTTLSPRGTMALILALVCGLLFIFARGTVARLHLAANLPKAHGPPWGSRLSDTVASREFRGSRMLFLLGVSLIGVLTLRVGGQITLSDVLFGFSFVVVCAELTFRRWITPFRISSTFLVGMALFTLGGVISTFEAIEPIKSFAVIVRLIILTFLWFWLATLVLTSMDHVARAMRLWVLTAAICGSAAIVQVVAGDVVPGSNLLYGRATGLTTHPNDLGGLTSIAFVPALVLASLYGLSRRRRTLSYVLLLIVAAGLVVSGSVGALLATVVATFVWLALQRFSANSVLVAFAVGLCVIATIGIQTVRGAPTPLQRLHSVTAMTTNTSGSGSLEDRVSTYHVAFREIREHPFVGVGLDLVSVTRPSGVVSYANDVHNLVIGTWYKTGLVGLLGMLIAIFAVLSVGWSNICHSTSENEEMIAVGLVSAVVAFVVFSMSEPVLYSRYGWISAALVFALRAAQQRNAVAPDVAIQRGTQPTIPSYASV